LSDSPYVVRYLSYRIYSLINRIFLPGIWPVFCLRFIRTTYQKLRRISLEECMIQKSFKKCSISNGLDGTEDDILWTDVRNDTHDTDEEDEGDTYDDLPYL